MTRGSTGYADGTPERDLDRSISHLLSTAVTNAGHLDVHTAAAAKAVNDPVLLAHHLRHAGAHARMVSSHLVKLRDHVTRRLPAVGRELAGLDRAIPGNRSAEGPVPSAALDMSIAHDIASGQAASAHTSRHLSEAALANEAGNKASAAFNVQHASHHVTEVSHYLSELDKDLKRKLPPVERENVKLHQAVNPEEPSRSPSRSFQGYDVAWDRGPVPA